jgi:hypothetical protein
MQVNMDKTNVIHFRPNKCKRTKYNFKLGKENVAHTQSYKYLGLYLDEHLNYKTALETLSRSASKALGALTAKYIKAKGLHFRTYTKLYNSTILPIMNYASVVWSTQKTMQHERIHYRAMRTFIGVPKNTPIPGLYGETGWHTLKYYRNKDDMKFWLKLYNMPNDRLTKQVFNWDYRRALTGQESWNKNIKVSLTQAGGEDVFYGLHVESSKKTLAQEIRFKKMKYQNGDRS